MEHATNLCQKYSIFYLSDGVCQHAVSKMDHNLF